MCVCACVRETWIQTLESEGMCFNRYLAGSVGEGDANILYRINYC